METCEVVTIITENGPVEINKSDYDANPGAYELAGGAAKAEAPKPAAKSKKAAA